MTAQEILDAASGTRAALAALEQSLAARIDEIEGTAFDAHRPFTPAESSERDQLRASLSETRDAFRELAFVTLQQLDRSDTVKHLVRDMQDVNRQIADDLDRLKGIALFASTAAQVADGLAQVVAGLAKFAAA
jgi:hypothetical protein